MYLLRVSLAAAYADEPRLGPVGLGW